MVIKPLKEQISKAIATLKKPQNKRTFDESKDSYRIILRWLKYTSDNRSIVKEQIKSFLKHNKYKKEQYTKYIECVNIIDTYIKMNKGIVKSILDKLKEEKEYMNYFLSN